MTGLKLNEKHETLGEKAVYFLAEGCNCTQNGLLAVYASWHHKNELVQNVAAVFESGIGRCGSVCDAVMVVGISTEQTILWQRNGQRFTIWCMIFRTSSTNSLPLSHSCTTPSRHLEYCADRCNDF
jgi:hypothetical protein